MVTTPKPDKSKPWGKYRRESSGQGQDRLHFKLLIPGWGGQLSDEELQFIVAGLERDPSLRLWWGMKPSWKRIPEEVVRRVAAEGDPDDQAHNRRLARPRQQSRAAA